MCTSTEVGIWQQFNPGERRRVVAALENRGLRLTPQREAVCEAVFGCPGHICVEHILKVVTARRPALRMNKTTVYRALDLLLDLGLVTEHKCGDGPAQYEPAWRGRHSHLICSRCGDLLDMNEEIAGALRRALQDQHAFQVDLEGYPIFGLCRSCRS